MCGVFGWIKRQSPFTDLELSAARAATRKLQHRGPDNYGEWSDDRSFMGHQRLTIIDHSTAAHQPFHGPDDHLKVSFNGEIYNYLELRKTLKEKGFEFQTNSDTEVLIQSYEYWGNAAFSKFEGMYAGALHDSRTGSHIIFRDPMGQKPLYYYLSNEDLIYASELRSLLALKQFQWRLDREAFAGFLSNSYYAGTNTPITGLKKLLPGHHLSLICNKVNIGKFWHSVPRGEHDDISPSQALNSLDGLISKSCEHALRSDVPAGVFLSGGIDSSLILSYCHDIDHDLQAVSVAMTEQDFDESAKAKAVADTVGIRHHTVIKMDESAVVENLDHIFSFNDEPHGDPGFVNARFIAAASKSQFTVGLGGDGGDELFYGYPPFHALSARAICRKFPPFIIDILRTLIRGIPERDGYLGLRFKLESLLRAYPAAGDLDFPLWLTTMRPEDLSLLAPSLTQCFDREGRKESAIAYARELLNSVTAQSPAQRLAYFYQQQFLPEFVCMHTDRASMQVSLEVRSPFLSPSLISFANSLPDNMKLRSGQDKWLLRRLAERRGLDDSISNQQKQGFTLPLARWLKTCLREKMETLLHPEAWSQDADLIDLDYMRRLVEDHLANRANNYRILFNLMAFQAWRMKFPDISSAR